MKSNLKKLRKEKGMTQGQLAHAIGAAQSSLQNWESGRNVITKKYRQKLCDFFDIEESELYAVEAVPAEWAEESELYDLVSAMTQEGRDVLLAIARTLYEIYRDPNSSVVPPHIEELIRG